MRVVVGRVVRPHGIRGEVVVVPGTDRPDERFARGARLHRSTGGDLVVRAARPHGDRWLVSLAGVSTRDQAEGLRGVVRALVPVVDLDKGELVIDPPEGLLDDEGGDRAPRRGDDLS